MLCVYFFTIFMFLSFVLVFCLIYILFTYFFFCDFFFFKQKTAYEVRISDWSSDVCSSDLGRREDDFQFAVVGGEMVARVLYGLCSFLAVLRVDDDFADAFRNRDQAIAANAASAPHLEFSVTKLGDGNGLDRTSVV